MPIQRCILDTSRITSRPRLVEQITPTTWKTTLQRAGQTPDLQRQLYEMEDKAALFEEKSKHLDLQLHQKCQEIIDLTAKIRDLTAKNSSL